MEQRPLRLGDIVDDYCPRERRVTNHAVVAIVEDAIRQTRCMTCDVEHPYKGAREPRLRKKIPAVAGEDRAAPMSALPNEPAPPPDVGVPLNAGADDAADAALPEPEPDERAVDGWLAHRQLIRATLPRAESDPPAPRPIPEFTMHQRQTRGSRQFRFHGGNGNANANGNVNGNVNGNANGNVNGPARGGFGQGRSGKPGRRHRHRRPR